MYVYYRGGGEIEAKGVGWGGDGKRKGSNLLYVISDATVLFFETW